MSAFTKCDVTCSCYEATHMVCRAPFGEDLGKGPWQWLRHPPLYPTSDHKGSAIFVQGMGHQFPPSQGTNQQILLLEC